MSILTQDWTRNRHRGPLDLRNTLILVPTRHAGRRLRAELAQGAAQHGSAVLAGRIVTPEHLLPLPPDAAPDALALSLLARRLLDQRKRNTLNALFPAQGTEWTFAFALGIAAQLQDVRRQLADADVSVRDLLPAIPDEEKDRWSDIARLETDLLQDLRRLGLRDPFHDGRHEARPPPASPAGFRILALFIPDLSALAARTLQSLAGTCDVQIHILAPESEAARFDEWGRPLPDRWETEPLPIDETQIHVVEQAPDETDLLAALLLEADRRNRALTLCTPDPDNARALARRLQIHGHPLYLPHGVFLAATAPGQLLSAWLALLRTRSYAAAAAFLRHPDAQDWLTLRLGLDNASALLSELDQCQAAHLPATVDDLLHVAAHGDGQPILARALQEITAQFDAPLPNFLADLYDCRKPAPSSPPDPLFADAAQALSALVLSTAETAERLRLSRNDALDLLQAGLSREQVFPKPNSSAIRETTGWLEVQWETTPALLLADMREGVVPETHIGDAFLPDSLRTRAGLAGNRDAFARDLYLARALLASRPPGGVRFLYSRRAANQDPQLPSRLLLACPDAELPARVALLFDRPALRAAPSAPARPILQLAPPACPPGSIPKKLSVTDFSSYLACPFRFYLSRVLRMRAEDDAARELDPMGFGSLAHDALALLKIHPLLDDEDAIQGLLLAELDRLATTQVGPHPSLALLVQLDSLRQRLRAAAQVHAASVREGWRIISAEEACEAELDGMLLRARIDRIDRHIDDGRLRILDYKTTDAGKSPAETHYQSRKKAWIDLQLPLYRYIYEKLHPRLAAPPPPDSGSRPPPPCAEGEQRSAPSGIHSPTPISVGYFNLPKAAGDTRIVMLDFQTKDGDLYPSALATARAVIADIQAGTFWPPEKKRPDHDDFALLFAGGNDLIAEMPSK